MLIQYKYIQMHMMMCVQQIWEEGKILIVQSRIADYIKRNGLKKRYVAEQAGIKIDRFSLIINNHVRLRADELEKICIALGVSVSEFIEDITDSDGGGSSGTE